MDKSLELDRRMPNVRLIPAIFICYNIDLYSNSKFQDLFFSYPAYRYTDMHRRKHTYTDSQTHADEYSIVAVKIAIVIIDLPEI